MNCGGWGIFITKTISLTVMKKTVLILFLFLLCTFVDSQAFTDSDLPIIIIQTDVNPNTGQPVEIPDEPKVLATMKIVYRPDGERNSVTDQNNPDYLNYFGRIGIELRGSSSQDLPKKPYGLTTLKDDEVSNNNVSILGMPKENDWVLNSLAFDPSMIRDKLSYELAGSMGNYAARGVYCEVMVNGDYKGVYVFMEKLKIDSNRIDIVKMTEEDNTGVEVTGGYITKADKTTGGDPVAWYMSSYNQSVMFIHESPKPENVTSQQHNYIHNQFNILQNALSSQNESVTDGFPSVIDIPSFIDYMLISELTSNVDSYQYSTFFHKDRNGKLRAGPVWDYNLTFGNDLFVYGYDRSHANVWQFDNDDNTGPKFWKDLYNNATFKCYLSKRWQELTAPGQPLSYDVITHKIDSLVNLLSEAKEREEARWNTIGDHASHINSLKTWLQNRMSWLNGRLNNSQGCAVQNLPALVISKINYHPTNFGDVEGEDLEYIEITNHSPEVVDLSGVYFLELGMSYQFPAHSVIGPNRRIYLASNAPLFRQVYSFTPFGQYTRNLSNKSFRLTLADAFGNIIDQVEYMDSAPWPEEADGEGSYLSLVNLDSDNNLAASWIASKQPLGISLPSVEMQVTLFPNPATNSITIVGNNLPLKSYEIFDLSGRVISKSQLYSNTIQIETLSPGYYMVQISFVDGTRVVKKVFKRT